MRVGANVQPGQDVVVTCLVEHAEIARAIAREAYRAGAKHVIVLYGDLHLRRAAIELGPEEELGWSPPYLLDWYGAGATRTRRSSRSPGIPNPDLLADLDPALVGTSEPKELRTRHPRAHRGAAHQLDDRRRAERGLGDAGLRRARRRAALGRRRDRDAARRGRSRGRVARARARRSRRGPTR